MSRGNLAEDLRNHLAVLVQDIEWLNDAFGDEVVDEVAEVLAEMTAAVGEIKLVADQLELERS